MRGVRSVRRAFLFSSQLWNRGTHTQFLPVQRSSLGLGSRLALRGRRTRHVVSSRCWRNSSVQSGAWLE